MNTTEIMTRRSTYGFSNLIAAAMIPRITDAMIPPMTIHPQSLTKLTRSPSDVDAVALLVQIPVDVTYDAVAVSVTVPSVAVIVTV